MYPVGTNVLNDRTIGRERPRPGRLRHLAQGGRRPAVVRDRPRHPAQLARVRRALRRVLAAAGFKVYLFPEHRSTPLLSFAVRHLKCDAGIMITASHNAPSDNGFKCYAADRRPGRPARRRGDHRLRQGGLRPRDPREPLRRGRHATARSSWSGTEVDDAYIAAVVGESVSHARDLSIVYTPMHGVGETSVAAALTPAGFTRLNILASQRTPDGDFPNVPGHVSNPEIPKTLDASIAEAKATGADLVLASDPDADRIGVGLPVTGDPTGEWTTLDGNQIGVLLAAFVIEADRRRPGKLRPDHYLVTTLVSEPDGPGPRRARGRPDRGRPARRLQVDRPADRRGRARRASSSASRSRTAT